jgi:hypothetical protein
LNPQSAKAKGRKFQQDIRDLMLQYSKGLEPDDILSRSMGAGGEDIMLSPAARRQYPITIECKCQEKVNVWASYAQAVENNPKEEYEPVLFIKRNRHKPLAVVDAEHYIKLTVTEDK